MDKHDITFVFGMMAGMVLFIMIAAAVIHPGFNNNQGNASLACNDYGLNGEFVPKDSRYFSFNSMVYCKGLVNGKYVDRSLEDIKQNGV